MGGDMVKDHHNRRFKSLRVSITGDCNLACTYCDPSNRCEPKHNKELTAEDIIKLVNWLVDILDIEKIRLTGGEPLLTPKLEQLLPAINQLASKDLSLTTNGQLLKQKAAFLLKNGLKRLNISLDTLDPEKYRSITGGGKLQRTLDGIEEALDQGIKVKVNMVPVRLLNDDEVVSMLDYCLEKKIELRYIELMQMGHLQSREKYDSKLVTMHQIFKQINKKHQFQPAAAPPDSTAKRYYIKDRGYFGIIANDSAPFCQNCNRLRLSSEGYLYGCLSSSKKFDLRPLLELPAKTAKKQLESILASAILTKQDFSFNGSSTLMRSVGG
jgi:GTP 3',8-cyclase